MRKSSVTSRSSFPSGAWSCHDDLHRLLLAVLAEILAHHAVLGAEQMLEEIFVALARRAQQIGAPDEQVARPVLRIVRDRRRTASVRRISAPSRHSPSARDRPPRPLRRRRADWSPAAARRAASPCVRRARCSRSARRPTGRPARSARGSPDVERLVAPLIGVGIEGRGRIHLPRRTAPVEAEGERQSSRTAAAAFPGRHNATSRRRIVRRIRTSPAC